MRLEGKVALITGAGSGFGASCAILFAEQGAKIIASDINSNTASRVANQVRESGGKAIAVKGDVTKKTSCKRLVGQTIKYFGRLDILINSAGVTARSAPDDWDFEKKWDWVVRVNLKGTMMMSYFVIAKMKKQGSGAIVNLASVMGLVGYPHGLSDGFNPYPHTKGGVVQMTRDMGVALAKQGIRVNALCPGFTYTALTKTMTNLPQMRAKLEALHPMGRLAEPGEIAQAALFLASDEASFITGACLAVDGGYTAQ